VVEGMCKSGGGGTDGFVISILGCRPVPSSTAPVQATRTPKRFPMRPSVTSTLSPWATSQGSTPTSTLWIFLWCEPAIIWPRFVARQQVAKFSNGQWKKAGAYAEAIQVWNRLCDQYHDHDSSPPSPSPSPSPTQPPFATRPPQTTHASLPPPRQASAPPPSYSPRRTPSRIGPAPALTAPSPRTLPSGSRPSRLPALTIPSRTAPPPAPAPRTPARSPVPSRSRPVAVV
jgi:hypothetical protein